MAWLISRAMSNKYENSLCSPAPAAESSAEHYLDGVLYAPSNTTSTRPACSWRGRMTDACYRFRSGMTFGRSTADRGEAALTSFLEAFPVRTLARHVEADGADSTEIRAAYGGTCDASLERSRRRSYLQKTLPCYDEMDFIASYPILPRCGMTVRGECIPLPTLAHDTSVRGYGSSERIGTIVATVSIRSPHFRRVASLNPYELCKADGGRPKHEWLEHLMGWPDGWTDIARSATDRYRQWRRWHGES